MDLHEPWLVAAWPGMGAVGLGAVAHLAKTLEASPLGEVGTREFFDVGELAVKGGVILPARRPRCWLLGWKAPPGGGRDLALLVGEAQPPSSGWEFAQAVVALAVELGAKRVVTFAAMATPLDPRAPARVFVAASDAERLEEARQHGVEVLEEGGISGLNGVLIGAAAEAGIPGLCLLGEFPYYAQGYPNPRASAAVLEAFGRLSGVTVDVADLEAQARGLEEELVDLQRHARDLAKRVRGAIEGATAEGDEANGEENGEESGEESVASEETRARLEPLFEAARSDRARAMELKAELDRLGLFREYEDRFLDLFKRGE